MENLEYQFQHQSPNDLKFMAVLKWKEENKDASFLQLQKALENCHINKHILCQVIYKLVNCQNIVTIKNLYQVYKIILIKF